VPDINAGTGSRTSACGRTGPRTRRNAGTYDDSRTGTDRNFNNTDVDNNTDFQHDSGDYNVNHNDDTYNHGNAGNFDGSEPRFTVNLDGHLWE
jgi:hypothetical protein